MEEACSSGDFTAAKQCFESLFRYDEEPNDTIRVDMAPGAADVIGRSLCAAATNGHVLIVEYLLEQGAPITQDLIVAVCRADRVNIFEAMLRHGWDINGWKAGIPPLRDALTSVPCTQWLLEHGADPNPTCKGDSKDLLTYAAVFESTSIVELLVNHGARVRGTLAIHAAAAATSTLTDDCTWEPDPSRVEVLRILLDNGADVNEMEEDPKWRKNRRLRTCFTGTPLHHAVQYPSLDAVRFLLSRGADPLHPSWSGHTVIEAAERAGREDVVEMLRQHVQCATQ
ncbi:ankyrin repeat-containing domain protein [Coniochaeta sp. 2T2.1]|nr:ankyrin repeat-containing domain protein [Coniochaeta sp. 2T2.1]